MSVFVAGGNYVRIVRISAANPNSFVLASGLWQCTESVIADPLTCRPARVVMSAIASGSPVASGNVVDLSVNEVEPAWRRVFQYAGSGPMPSLLNMKVDSIFRARTQGIYRALTLYYVEGTDPESPSNTLTGVTCNLQARLPDSVPIEMLAWITRRQIVEVLPQVTPII